MDSEAAYRARTLAITLPKLRPALAAVVVGSLLLWFSFPAFVSLHTLWLDDFNYSHGYLVLVMTVFLVAREAWREPLQAAEPSLLGVACFVALALAMTVGHASSIILLEHVALPALWLAALWALTGMKNARRLAFPLGFLYFAIELWDLLTEPLRRLTIAIVSAGIRLLDVPAFIDGNLIYLPSGTFEVAGGCAGLRYAIVAATLGAFVGYLYHGTRARTLLLTACALVLGLIGNWLRVFIMVLVGHYSEMQHYLITEEHTSLGWVLFLLCMVPLLYLHRRLPAEATSRAPTAGTMGRTTRLGSRRAVMYSVGVVLALGVWLNHRIQQGADNAGTDVVLVAPEIPGWRRAGEWQDARRPYFIGATSDVAHWYEDGPARVGAYLAHYANQTQGHEIVYALNRPEGRAATVVARKPVRIAGASGSTLTFEELEVEDSASRRRLVWLSLRAAGEVATGRVAAKVLQIVGAIRGRRDGQALVLTASCGEQCGAARASLARYAAVATARFFEQTEGAPAPGESEI